MTQQNLQNVINEIEVAVNALNNVAHALQNIEQDGGGLWESIVSSTNWLKDSINNIASNNCQDAVAPIINTSVGGGDNYFNSETDTEINYLSEIDIEDIESTDNINNSVVLPQLE